MARDDGEQQAMTSERLAEIQARAHAPLPTQNAEGVPLDVTLVGQPLLNWVTAAMVDRFDLLAEVERRRAAAMLLQAQADGAASLLLDVQRDCISLRKREAALLAVVERVAEDAEVFGWQSESIEQARALLATTAEGSGGDGA